MSDIKVGDWVRCIAEDYNPHDLAQMKGGRLPYAVGRAWNYPLNGTVGQVAKAETDYFMLLALVVKTASGDEVHGYAYQFEKLENL